MSSTELDLLTLLPTEDRNYILSLLSHTDILRVSACNHSLRCTIRNDKLLWQALYKHKFLSGVYCKEEWDFVFWCIRTNPNTTSIPAKRSDMQKNVDWYDVYRRRVITEYNWQHGYSNTTEIDLKLDNEEEDESKVISICDAATNVRLEYDYEDSNGQRVAWYNIEYSAYSDLKHSGDRTQRRLFSTLSNKDFLHGTMVDGVNFDYSFLSDHYIIKGREHDQEGKTIQTMSVSVRGGDTSTRSDISVPFNNRVIMIEGKWALLYDRYYECDGDDNCANIIIIDMENGVRHLDYIKGDWHIICFYTTDDESATIYTARVKEDDKTCIEWTLHRFSGTSTFEQLHSGWFHLPEIGDGTLTYMHTMHPSRMTLEFFDNLVYGHYHYVVHSVASSGQGETPKHSINITAGQLPIPLLKAGLKCFFDVGVIVHCNEAFDDDQIIQFPNIIRYDHIIGSLYGVEAKEDEGKSIYLLDIDSKATLRVFEQTDKLFPLYKYSLTGRAIEKVIDGQDMILMEEYGAL